MSVTNRKLFRPRNARNKLNQMGGIMASSPELASTVANFSQGGPVAKFQNGNIVRVPSRNPSIPSNRQLVPTTQIPSGQNVGVLPKTGIIQTLRGAAPLLTAALAPSMRQEAPFPEELAGIGAGETVNIGGTEFPTVPAYQPQGLSVGITREQFDALPDEEKQAYLQAENDRRALKRTGIQAGLGKFSEVYDTVANAAEFAFENPLVERGAKALGLMSPEDSFESRFPSGAEYAQNVALAENRPLTVMQFRAGLPSTEERAERATTEEQYMAGPGAAMPRPSVEEEDILGSGEGDLVETIPRPEGAETTTTETTETTETTQTTPVPPGEADKQVTEAADLGAIFDQSNTQTESDPLGTSTGTDMEELKQKIMGLMPQYDEEASTKRQGLLIAQMGAAIAAGKSGDAITNIAEGIQKTLPGLIRESEKREKFKTELEAGAAKIAVTEGLTRDREARAEERAVAKEARKKQNYFLESDVDMNIGGRQVTGKAGQLVRLNENEVNRAMENGIPLTTETALVNQLKLRAKEVENGTGTLANLYNDKAVTYSPETSYFKGVRYYEPNPKGAQLGVDRMYTASSINQIQSAYTNQKNELTSSLYLVDAGIQLAPQATGAAGTFGRMRDQFIGVIGEENAKRFGLDPKALSGATEFDVMQRMMAAKFAPLLLGESGKTISDQDRQRVAALLGINLDTGETLPGFFQNPRQVEKALREVKGILLQNNAALDNEYTALLQGSYGPGMQPISVQPVGGDNLGVPSKITLSEEEFQRYMGQ